MGRLWRLAVVLALLAVACRAETNVVLEIREDGSGTYTVELGLDQELQDLLAGFTGGEGNGIIPGFDLDVPGLDGNPLESLDSRVEGDMTFYTSTDTFTTTEELERLVTTAGGENSFETFDVTIDGDLVTLTAQAGAPGDLAGGADELPISLDIIEQAFEASIIVRMPGTVTERNADEVLPDGRLRWEISLTDGVDVRAVSDLSESSFPWWIVIVIIVAALALVGGLWFSRRSAARPAAAVAATTAPPDPRGFVEPATVLEPFDPFADPPEDV